MSRQPLRPAPPHRSCCDGDDDDDIGEHPRRPLQGNARVLASEIKDTLEPLFAAYAKDRQPGE
ncbi:hypothetical protein, partial [Methylorubrum rhodesianum]|uniref:hypothetical protein n=1 Tax=Methylorubrum rhodesianum TaxID=29427 RepID=UPI003747255A